MQLRRLGNSNLQVSALCLGTMMFGDQTALAEAQAIVDHAHAMGVNFIDTADVYSKGDSERMAGDSSKRGAMSGCWPASWATPCRSG